MGKEKLCSLNRNSNTCNNIQLLLTSFSTTLKLFSEWGVISDTELIHQNHIYLYDSSDSSSIYKEELSRQNYSDADVTPTANNRMIERESNSQQHEICKY